MPDRRVVYATGIGRVRHCPICHQPEDQCAGHRAAAPERPGMPHDGIVRITLDRKGRGGKPGTLIVGLPGDEALLADLCKHLKRLCGAGGTAKQGEIFIQGDHRDLIEKELTAKGYKIKRVGG